MSETLVFTTSDPEKAVAVLARGLYEGWVASCYRVPDAVVDYLRPDVRQPLSLAKAEEAVLA